MTPLDQLFQHLWDDYCAFNPSARKVHDLLTARGEVVINDHIALRTLAHPRLGIQHLARMFEMHGYTPRQEYTFVEKKLWARHWEHSDPRQPKVFISELQYQKLSARAQSILESLIEQMTTEFLGRPDVTWAGRTWNLSHQDYLQLSQESEYAAWFAAHGFRPNHFTVFFNELKTFKDLADLNTFLKTQGYALNNSGGEIKGTPAELLEQSSTLAELTEVQFSDGRFQVPACYYEFARRYPNPGTGELYTGFIAASADKIFESTNRQT